MAEDEDKAELHRRLLRAPQWLVVERMRLHGFWPAGEPIPDLPPELAAEREKLERIVKSAQKSALKLENPEAALREERIRRWQESKKRRAIARAELEAAKRVRAAEYKDYARSRVVHLGEGVSAGLQNTEGDLSKLASAGLPLAQTGTEIAAAMGILIGTLRWLTYHRRTTAVVHYHRYEIPKKTGGTRGISAPKPSLAKAQRWVLDRVLSRLSPSEHAHGFVPGRSIVTNAAPHVGQGVVVNMDLKDFFPSLSFRRVKGLFRGMGYSEHAATVFALLCTEPPRVAATLKGQVHHVALGERALPQGACTSPAITNLVCRRLDARLAGLARSRGFTFTRYADDLTFSGPNPRKVGPLLRGVRMVLAEEGFVEHPSKTKVMRRGRRQEVTGLVVNDRLSVPRETRRRLRALLHNARRTGLAEQNREGHPAFQSHLWGLWAFIGMVDATQAARIFEDLREVSA